jgi:hypothetical protein
MQGLVWRASLESARTGERRGFADLTHLCAFLEEEVTQVQQRDWPRAEGQNKDGGGDHTVKDATDHSGASE